MLTVAANRFAPAALAVLSVLALLVAPSFARRQATPADTVLLNRAESTYRDEEGNEYGTVSPTVTVTVRAVSAVQVTPDETEPSAAVAQNERVARLFRVCNNGNTPDLYTLTQAEVSAPSSLASLHFDTDTSGTLTDADTPASIDSTLSPRLAPAACVGVIATVDVNGAAPGTRLTIRLTARSNVSTTANGLVTDSGTIINAVGERARLTDPTTPTLPPLKLVNNRPRVTAAPAEQLDYTVSFRNSGAVTARNVLLADDLPAGLEYVPGSMRLGNRALTDAPDADEGRTANNSRRLELRLAEVKADEVVTLSFRSRVTGDIPPGTGAVNVATLSGDNFEATGTVAATAVINPFGVVFAGRSGGATQVAGARVSLLTAQTTDSPLSTVPDIGFTPNEQNENPYTTKHGGTFSFALSPAQLGTPSSPAVYYLSVAAPGYRRRLIELTVRPAALGLYAARIRALDEQQLAVPGGFALTESEVTLENLASVALNIPVFELQSLEIAKTADQQRAEIGDVVNYRVEVRNTTQGTLRDLVVTDQLPVSFHYAPGTATLRVGADEQRRLDPEVAGNTLTFRLPALPAGAAASITYRVRVGANAREGDQVNSAVASGRYASGERVTTQPARATVRVGAGVFSTRQIIIGRVFVDANGNGEFDRGERPVPGARLYIDNGQSVVTDSEGLYNLPSVEDGAVVIALDPVTVPRGLMLADGGQRSGRSWTRLLRTPLGGGTLLRQNFALTGTEADALEATNAHAQLSTGDKPNGNDKSGGNDKSVGAGLAPARSGEAANRDSSVVNDSSVVSLDSIPSMSALAGGGQGQALPLQKSATTSQAASAVVNAVASRDENGNGAASKSGKVSGARIEKTSDARTVKAEDRAGKPADAAPLAAGTYEVEATETLAPVAPGELVVVSPAAGAVVMQPAMQVVVRVAKDWSAALEVNGTKVSAQNVGERRVDHRNNVSTYKFVGLSLRPGRNSVRAFAVAPSGEASGKPVEFVVMGRGPARRLEIAAEREELQAGGRDSVLVRVRAFDEWGNPAADGLVGLSTTGGHFERVQAESTETVDASGGSRFDAPDRVADEQNRQPNQLALTLRGGEAVARLVSGGAVGQAELLAKAGEVEAEKKLRFTAELRPTILVGLAEASFGKAAPENALRGDTGSFRSHVEFFFRGPVFGKNLVTLAYDSQRSLNRTMGRDRLFQLDPLDRVYPVFGDSSTHFDEAESNSKLYARVDRGRSYAMFGDFEADMNESSLAGYARKLTGVKVHLENSQGDFLTVTGARPDTAFARDVFPASRLGLVTLTHADVLQGSESVVLEVRDRRNPERIISREQLVRSVDYNLDPLTGHIFFLRSISAFDYDLNLVQVVVTYEHRAAGMSSAVYTGRASKRFSSLGLRLGLSYVDQRQREFGSYRLAGLDGEKELWNRGWLKFEYANSRGELATAGNLFGGGERHAGGSAYRLELMQPFELYEGVVRAEYARADEGFFNPFGATVSPGSRRMSASVDLKPARSRKLTFGFTNERNRTANVDNERNTVSFGWTESFGEKLQVFAGYDYRNLSDAVSEQTTNSHLLTVGAQYRPTEKLELSVKREQNLSEADPTFPDQTTLAARYRWNDATSLFFTQRLASAPIVPISDTAQTGFSLTNSRRETAIGVETRLSKYTSVVGRYQLENGINGTDSFAVIGLQNRLPVSKQLALDLGFEHGFHVAGLGTSFTSGAFGLSYLPAKDLKTSARYELRNQQGGLGQILTLGAAGRVGDNVTTLARFQWARTHFAGRENESMLGTAAVAWRPLNSDRHAVLFSYTRRELSQSGFEGRAGSTERADILSTDAFWQPLKDTELFGRFALKFGRDSREGLLPAEALTYVSQLRLQRRLRRAFDVAAEARLLSQPSTRTRRTSVGTELGYWIFPDIRLGIGYNFTAADEPAGSLMPAQPRGWYFTVSTKLSSLFDLFGTSADGLAPSTTATTSDDKRPANDKLDAPPPDKP
jgi:uncharacterized repeat protein (TIGR01451 family)